MHRHFHFPPLVRKSLDRIDRTPLFSSSSQPLSNLSTFTESFPGEEESSMNALKPCNFNRQSPLLPTHSYPQKLARPQSSCATLPRRRLIGARASGGEGENKAQSRRSFLTLEEAGLVELSGLSSHERFLCRLTISSLNLLRVISEQEGCAMEELNAGRICDWFVKDKLKREQNLEDAVLQWDDSEFQF
ncbi:hypothetical protein NMG60_11022328 [Bertholletia excelsa]